MSIEGLCISVKDAAGIYGLCENTFRLLVNRSDFPKIKVGRRIVIIRSQLLEYMERLARGEASMRITTQGEIGSRIAR